jgi:hypothetical protein
MSLDLVVLVGDQPMPAPGASEVEVIEQIGAPASFAVRAAIPHIEDDFPTLRDARTGPDQIVTIGTTVNEVTHVLCHGPIHGHRAQLAHGGTGTVELTGGDEMLVMDRDIVAKVWPDGAPSDAIAAILRDRGFKETVDPVDAQFAQADHALMQHDSDLRFVRRLARRYGYWFWLRRDPRTKETHAYFKRPPKPPPKIAVTISINNDNPAVDSLDLEWDVARPTTAIAQQLGMRDKQPIDGQVPRSPAPPLAKVPFADIAPVHQVRVTAPVDSVGDLRARAEAALIDAGWFVRVRGTTTARKLGGVLRAHDHVNLSGVGRRHSGTYVVARVRHYADVKDHRMEFELVRNAWEE